MASFTIFSGATDGYISSASATYATARSGSSLTAYTPTSGDMTVGQADGYYYIYQSFTKFDCSSVTGAASAATLSLYGNTDQSATDFTIEARTKDWGAGVTTADWVAGAGLSALTLLASRSSSGLSTAAYNAFTSQAALLTEVDLHATVYMMLCSAEQTNNSTPTTSEYVAFYVGAQAGTTKDPKLEITTADAEVIFVPPEISLHSIGITRPKIPMIPY